MKKNLMCMLMLTYSLISAASSTDESCQDLIQAHSNAAMEFGMAAATYGLLHKMYINGDKDVTAEDDQRQAKRYLHSKEENTSTLNDAIIKCVQVKP